MAKHKSDFTLEPKTIHDLPDDYGRGIGDLDLDMSGRDPVNDPVDESPERYVPMHQSPGRVTSQGDV